MIQKAFLALLTYEDIIVTLKNTLQVKPFTIVSVGQKARLAKVRGEKKKKKKAYQSYLL